MLKHRELIFIGSRRPRDTRKDEKKKAPLARGSLLTHTRKPYKRKAKKNERVFLGPPYQTRKRVWLSRGL
jgi:hypothetical protein